MTYARESICAVATPPGRGGIGVVRLSCDDPRPFMLGLLGREIAPRYAARARFLDTDGDVIDDGIALYFAAPHSFTGEHVLELQGHGGPVVQRLLLERCLQLGARLATPGEFSQRAFLNGKLDLAQAEAVIDLIDAGSAQGARAARRALEGEFSRRVNTVRDALIELRALVEAILDFPEEDIDVQRDYALTGRLDAIADRLAAVLEQARQGALLREGLNVVLIGQPNVGKSSLMNALAGHDAAIVTEIAGTTRDVLREAIQIDGIPLHLFDTAGLRETEDQVERLGIARAWAELERADIAVLLVDATHGVGAKEAEILARLPEIPVITVHNKVDLTQETARIQGDEIWLSAKIGSGIDLLRTRLLSLAGWRGAGDGVISARARHLHALRRAGEHLSVARRHAAYPELFAEELRLAQDALGTITGACHADDLLGVIFAQFCIGK